MLKVFQVSLKVIQKNTESGTSQYNMQHIVLLFRCTISLFCVVSKIFRLVYELEVYVTVNEFQ